MILQLCKYMGWGYDTYLRQPEWFVDGVIIMMNEEAASKKHG